jgi:hypothetical protein
MRGKGQAEKDKQKEKDALAARKAAEQRKKDEVASLYTPIDIVQAKVPFGVGEYSSKEDGRGGAAVADLLYTSLH